MYSPTCLKQAAKGNTKIACLGQVGLYMFGNNLPNRHCQNGILFTPLSFIDYLHWLFSVAMVVSE